MTDTIADNDREAMFDRLRTENYDLGSGAAEGSDAPDPSIAAPTTVLPETPAFDPPEATYTRAPASVVVLVYPFTMSGRKVRQITLLPPRMDYVRAAAAGDISRLDMIAEMASVPVDVLSALRWPDAERVLALAADLAPELARN